eukprot:765459-Prymnesium_polylepis.1
MPSAPSVLSLLSRCCARRCTCVCSRCALSGAHDGDDGAHVEDPRHPRAGAGLVRMRRRVPTRRRAVTSSQADDGETQYYGW